MFSFAKRKNFTTWTILLVAVLALFLACFSTWGFADASSSPKKSVHSIQKNVQQILNQNQQKNQKQPQQQKTETDVGGGSNCAACTIIVGLLEQLSQIHNQSIDYIVEQYFCNLFPDGPVKTTCDQLVALYGGVVIKMLENKETADTVCLEIKICTNSTCRLFPAPSSPMPFNIHREYQRALQNSFAKQGKRFEDPTWSPIDWIKDLINRLSNQHEPVEDIDKDLHSSVPTLRGYNWRGFDCNDFDDQMYPGRQLSYYPPEVDHNCNGINGTAPNGQSYEEYLCSGANTPKGIILLGDSAGAHFEIPPQWMTASEINGTTYKDILSVIEDEVDWPEYSFGTGWNQEGNPDGQGTQSVYLLNRQRNLCSNNDYANLGINGERASSEADNGIDALNRNQTTDYPALVLFELIGNDVCNWRHSLSAMTTPADFEQGILDSLAYLDQHLPAGSSVMFLGLAHGEVLWDILHDQIHPIGVPYPAVYDFLNCLYISPCWGWMNSNEEVRNATTEHAMLLSTIYPQIIEKYSSKFSFDMAYYNFPFQDMLRIWVAQGGNPVKLIEPVDGFHPSGIANGLLAQIIFDKLLKDHPTFLNNINPNNDIITKLFGIN